MSDVQSIASILSDNYRDDLSHLIAEPAFQKVWNLTSDLPVLLSDFFGYEIRLGKNTGEPDFLLCIHEPDDFRKALEDHKTLGWKFSIEVMEGFHRLAALWASDVRGLHQHVLNFWLEFDYEDICSENPKPNFFFAPNPSGNRLDVVLAAEKLFDAFYRKYLSSETYKNLLKCYQLLGKQGVISQIGMMNARNDEKLRLFIQRLGHHNIIPFLASMDYPHVSNNKLKNLLELCYRFASHVDLDIDIEKHIGENIGIECYFESIESALLFLREIGSLQLCTPENEAHLSEHLKNIYPDFTQPYQSAFSHFKINYKAPDNFTAKVYLGYISNILSRRIVKTLPYKQTSS